MSRRAWFTAALVPITVAVAGILLRALYVALGGHP